METENMNKSRDNCERETTPMGYNIKRKDRFKKIKRNFQSHMSRIKKNYNPSLLKLKRLKNGQMKRNGFHFNKKKATLANSVSPINKSQEFQQMNRGIFDDPYQTLSKPLNNKLITNLELENVTFKNDEAIPNKNRSTGKSKRLSSTFEGFGSNKGSFKGNQRLSVMYQDYLPSTSSSKKRPRVYSKRIIRIYEEDQEMRAIHNTFKNRPGRKTYTSLSKKRFQSNKSLIGIKMKTKALTRAMNMTIQEKNMKRESSIRPMTSDITRKFNKGNYSVATKAPINHSSYSLHDTNIGEKIGKKRYSSSNPIKKNKLKKSESSEKSYSRLRKRILEECRLTEQQLASTNKRCKKFFWSPDFSFCAFATKNQMKKTAALYGNKSSVSQYIT
ncbi:unnamed protein product [Moneuplotes crassus]|uniref:Uncharacterized protein n=1 Tax=Euplotes crassus TaxID=5936 RepID=A0AAD1UIA2_EUPCR|nr:unnamed protein product [Moneuplotes crassus]